MNRYRNITLDVNDEDIVEEVRQLIKDQPAGNQDRTETTTVMRRDRVVSSARRSAFTLIELLVVITIISLLATLVVPAVNRARDMAVNLQCLSNLRSLGQATYMFAASNNDRLPNPTDRENAAMEVRNALAPLGGGENAFLCPRDPESPPPPEGSYDWRFTDDPECSLSGVTLARIGRPAELVLAGDREPGWHGQETINVVFADSRAKNIPEDDWFENLSMSVK